jgi:hypothetical protein
MNKQWIVAHIIHQTHWEAYDPSLIPNWARVCGTKDDAEREAAEILDDINALIEDTYMSTKDYNESSDYGFIIIAEGH